jgi:diketogulonate reductase-like aldo/keto reductase
MPYFGLGTFQAAGDKCAEAVEFALTHGYDSIDTAQAYENEDQVAKGWKASGRERGSFFLTTKVWNVNQGYDSAKSSVEQSLERLQTDYVDLLLVHWPNIEDFNRTRETWRAMIEMQEAGLARSIGVSNFTIPILEDFLSQTDVVPVLNQVEFHTFLYQKDLLDYCSEHQIQMEAYSPLARAKYLDDPVLQSIAAAHDKSTAQVMLAWLLHHNIVVIPKSVHLDRVAENADVFFEFSDEEMNALDALNRNERTIHPSWAPPSWKEAK